MRGKAGQSQDFNLTFPAVRVTPLGKKMPTQLLSLLVLSRATLRMVWPCKNGTRSHLSHLNIKVYPHSLRRPTPALVSTSLGGFWLDSGLKLLSSYLGNISGANQLPHSCRRPKVLSRREDYSSHQNLCLLRMHMVWDRLVRAEGCTAVCKLQLEKALGWSIKRRCLMSGHWGIKPQWYNSEQCYSSHTTRGSK